MYVTFDGIEMNSIDVLLKAFSQIFWRFELDGIPIEQRWEHFEKISLLICVIWDGSEKSLMDVLWNAYFSITLSELFCGMKNHQ